MDRILGFGKLLTAVVFLTLVVTNVNGQFKCPESRGFFPDSRQCDLYYACADGQPEERLCKDGLVFKDDNPKRENCDIPANVDCGDRTELQEPQPSKGCPRANGFFKHEDPASCDKFVNCIDGEPQVMPCPPGLVYEEKMSNCVWAIDAARPCIDPKREVLDDGFFCPEGPVIGPSGSALPHPNYPHKDDCAKFYICRNGMIPQKGQCDEGTVYNEDLFTCTEPESVPGCENYYKEKN
ncbi:hypothetical protein QAD02_018520 [Eretmocerus hayati]|uniref:Uncharacterized protein n=1 Tax=Eretmocerus hayati TaxID=131215 RepID=A0ACC2PI29_9HYME|nr:hypothetical protein QAD02_018520 [Eretmocerus hayati]